jgi:hypothetical protein
MQAKIPDSQDRELSPTVEAEVAEGHCREATHHA